MAAAFEIAEVSALEILDSRGRPTLSVSVALSGGGPAAKAGVPSGASTGTREATELRDGDKERYGGGGVLTAVSNVNTEIAGRLRGRTWSSAAEVDQAMIDMDGTPNKSRLGANAIVGVSMALARALAAAEGRPLWQWLTGELAGAAGEAGEAGGRVEPRLPVPHFNVVNGGAHAPNSLDFQEFMIAPLGSPTMAEAVRAGAEVYAALRRRLSDAGHSTGLGDEGGFAPDITSPEDVLRTLVAAIEDAGYRPGRDGVAIALDPAASEFRREDRYHVAGEALSSDDMIERYAAMVTDFPVWSIEDGLGEDDEEGWIRLTERIGDRAQLVGDDVLVTNPAIITRAIEKRIGNAALIKLNQVGTVTETLRAIAICRQAGFGQMISHRSGETTDAFIADLAVGSGCGQLKTGAPARGERVSKYNRLMEISAVNPAIPYGLAAE